MEDKKELLGNVKAVLAGGVLGLALLYGIHIIFPNNILKPKDFDNINWIKYNNKSGEIYGCYEKEVDLLNEHNWHLYIEKVREKNNNNLEGEILLPDLDGDGLVGK